MSSDPQTDTPPSFTPAFDAPAFDALTKKIDALDQSGKFSKTESMQLYKMMADAIIEEQARYFSVRQNTVHDYQRPVSGPDTLHVVQSLQLSAGAELIETMKMYRLVVEELGGEVVFVGKTTHGGLSSKQLSESRWDVFTVVQLDSREHWNELTANGDYKKMLESFDATYAIGFDRDPIENLGMSTQLLSSRIQQSLTAEPKRLPFKRAPDESPAAKQRAQYFTKLAADNAIYSTDAIVIVNFQKFGGAAQNEANSSYSYEMGELFSEGGHGPTHLGNAVKLEGDADFDRVVLVYYPGVRYFGDMVQSTFYTSIVSNKQLGDTLSSVTVPILQLLD